MPKHKALSLRDKVKVIEAHEKEKVPPKQLVVCFNCGKTQIYETIKNEDKILQGWFKGTAGQIKRLNARSTVNEDINSTTWELFVACRANRVLVSGPLIQEQDLQLQMAGLKVSEIATILSGVVYVVKLKQLIQRLLANGNKLS
ncbi:hypothetical protein PR048_033596 [Dryococelus australis]|uniref:HTH psq-type domain-containing protein n=1 Tax=Dryococelus australis TaxID=614101 RepID=A0ABQ9G1Z0_9NEOP|nr:hypothetical protein PR048_033596 [Dryococelus australis]